MNKLYIYPISKKSYEIFLNSAITILYLAKLKEIYIFDVGSITNYIKVYFKGEYMSSEPLIVPPLTTNPEPTKPQWPNDPFQPNKHMEESISNGTVPAVVDEPLIK